jgi:hypothetical protein
MKKVLMIAVAMMLTVCSASFAEVVTVECIGTVEYNQVSSGVFGAVSSGDPVYAGFLLDSENYIDSPTYNVRAYPINLASFQLDIGPVSGVPLVIPQPGGATPYFVVRDNDPAADGFFLSSDPEWPYVNPMLDVPGQLDPYFGFHWEVGYTGDTLASLDILDAIGSYDYTGLTSYYTAIQDAWADAMGLMYVQINIKVGSVATENASWGQVKTLYR